MTNPYPYPIQLDLSGRRVAAYDFLGLTVYRPRETIRDFNGGAGN